MYSFVPKKWHSNFFSFNKLFSGSIFYFVTKKVKVKSYSTSYKEGINPIGRNISWASNSKFYVGNKAYGNLSINTEKEITIEKEYLSVINPIPAASGTEVDITVDNSSLYIDGEILQPVNVIAWNGEMISYEIKNNSDNSEFITNQYIQNHVFNDFKVQKYGYDNLKDFMDELVSFMQDYKKMASSWKEKRPIFVMLGQSNMVGSSTDFIAGEVPVGEAYEYKYATNTLEQVKHRFGENVLTFQQSGNNSLSVNFAQAYHDRTGEIPVLIQVATSGKQISYYMDESYANIVKKVLAGIKKVNEENYASNIYLVFLQGESDGNNTKEDYKVKIKNLYENLKKDISVEKMFLIRVGDWQGSGKVSHIMQAQEEFANENDDVIMVTRMTQDWTNHYSASDYNLLGTTVGERVGEYIKNGTIPSLEVDKFLS